MALCHSDETEQMLSALRAEETRLLEALSATRTKLNDLMPISALPAEILEEIFGICISRLYGFQKSPHRLALTQVCRRWRFVSLNAARLWRIIDLRNPRLAQESFLRSASAPIHLSAWSPSQLCIEGPYIEGLGSHAERVKSVELNLFPEDMIKLFRNLGPSLPALTDLSLTVPALSTNFILDDLPCLPHLKALTLDCVSIPWHQCVGLTRLSLRGQATGYSPSLTQLRTIFEASPNLEHIRLSCITLALPDVDIAPPRLISLPQLREFNIAAKASVIQSILSDISLSPTTRLHINCSQFDGLDDLLPARLKAMYPLSDIRVVRLVREGVRLLTSAAAPWSNDPADWKVSFICPHRISERAFSADLPQFFDLSSVNTLELGFALNDWMINSLGPFLAQLPNLETLRIAKNDLEYLLDNLSHSELLCPRLKTLTIGSVESSGGWGSFGDSCLKPLVLFAKARRSASVPLETVEFVYSDIFTHNARNELEGLVGRVVFFPDRP
ncbi:hypothetical protein D9615_002056 [Tricholomella constricta]|uniref:F-box domain-containing protein n=1 Tax=Tricholomella constricta TaxID=117010 RepID=A0A8H5HPG9_9AGAR|nr:hypothetical protein D9615_002056 [Tricholomella constricta]